MVRITYRHKKGELVGDCTADASLLFVNGKGSYYLTAPSFSDPVHQWSRYGGLHIPYKTNDGWSLCKTLHGLFPVSGGVEQIIREQRTATIKYKSGLQVTYSLLPDDVLCAELSSNLQIDNESLQVILDCRGIHDFNTQGRIYSAEKISGANGASDVVLIGYYKHINDDQNSAIAKLPESNLDSIIYIAISADEKTGTSIRPKSDWFPASFELEKSRGSSLTSMYLYHGADIACNLNGEPSKVFFAAGFNRDAVLQNIEDARENHDALLRTMKQYSGAITTTVVSHPQFPLASVAHEQAILGLDSLFVKPLADSGISADKDGVERKNAADKTEGIYAGLPWFYQFWTRDEAIALGGLLEQKRYRDVKQLLFRQMTGILFDGRLSNRFPKSMLGSADGVGWCAKRWFDFIKQCANERVLSEYLSDKELVTIRDFFIDSYEKQKQHFSVKEMGGLFKNTALETWMDTSAGENLDVRDGYRIEIQALALAQLRLINTLVSLIGAGNKKSYNEEEMLLQQEVAKRFFVDGKLIDGINFSGQIDATQRPNVFLAHYIYPLILSAKQWESAFDIALKSLWLGWGGLSSIELNHPLFCPSYTGENNKSYHRGDSWYFLNNIAATSLWNVNAKKYRTSVEAIIASSVNDLLWSGALGWSSEVSNARNQSASGCVAQAWSMGTLIELLQTVFEKK